MLTYPQLDCLGNRKDPGNPSQLKMPRTPRHLFLLLICSSGSTVILIRSTRLSLNDAMETGNYTVLRDLATPSFREANSAGRLYQIFASLEAQHVSLAATTARSASERRKTSSGRV